MPNSTMCVTCLTEDGDVPIIRRFDEQLPDGEVSQVFFTDNSRIARQLRHTNSVVAGSDAFAHAVGDDSHLEREGNKTIGVARSLATLFTDDPIAAAPRLRQVIGRGTRNKAALEQIAA